MAKKKFPYKKKYAKGDWKKFLAEQKKRRDAVKAAHKRK